MDDLGVPILFGNVYGSRGGMVVLVVVVVVVEVSVAQWIKRESAKTTRPKQTAPIAKNTCKRQKSDLTAATKSYRVALQDHISSSSHFHFMRFVQQQHGNNMFFG